MKKLGYARVSTQEQVLDLQLDTLRQAGCDDVYTDTVSGVQAHKPNWEKLLAYARPGDTLVIWRLDRLGRSTKHLIEVVEDLNRRQLHLISLQDPIDTTSPGGQLVFQIFCALAEHERNVLVQRTHAGLQAARARGRQGAGQRAWLRAIKKSPPPSRNSMRLASSPRASSWTTFRLARAAPSTKFCALLAAGLTPALPSLLGPLPTRPSSHSHVTFVPNF